MPERLRDLLGDIAAVLVGVAAFFVFCGWWVLIPTNIAWLDFGDRAMHQLGWMFFRDAPWGVPPGTSTGLGIEIASSIALVDGLPLVALPVKLIAQWLPQPFQYWGYWLLLSFSLQSLFAYRLARELGGRRLVAILAAAFALLTPAFLYRIPLHLALSSHWVLLAGLYLYARRAPPRLWAWPLVAGITTAIHATLLAMVLAIWFASFLQRWQARVTPRRLLAVEVTLLVGALAGIGWLVGLFFTGSLGAGGYGSYKLNLLWPFIDYGWSQIVPDIPHTKYDYEGLSFLGIGVMALLLWSLATGGLGRLRAIFSWRWLPLAIILLLLTVFAFSKSFSVADIDLFTIDWPWPIWAIGAAFRSTGRFVWPLLYIITVGAAVLAAAKWPRLSVPLIVLALAAQIVDSQPGWSSFARNMAQPSDKWRTLLVSPFWERAAQAGYDRVRTIPLVTGYAADWKTLGYYAVTHGMDTDTVLLARVDQPRLQALRSQTDEDLKAGSFEPRTIYVVDVMTALTIMQHLRPGDLLATIDRRIVFVPGGARLIDGLDIENTARNGGSWVPPVAYGGSVPQ